MRTALWGAAAAAALSTCVPLVAEAATPATPVPTTPTPTGQLPAPVPVPSVPGSHTASAPATSSPSSPSSPSPTVRASGTTPTYTPAPGGSAEAYAARVGNLAAVSHTKASASGSGESATADPLELLGMPPAAAFGGTQTGPGSSSGALLDTGNAPFGRIALTPWTASATSTSSGNTASGLSDIVLVDLGGSGPTAPLSLRVLQSKSDASWTPTASSGSSSSDGATLELGGGALALDVLHSQASSSGTGSSYLASINGNQIGSSSQANGQCALSVPGILSLNCLTATGGTGTPVDGVLSSTAGVASATVGPAGSGLTAALIQSEGSSAQSPVAASTSPASGVPAQGTTSPAASSPAPASASPAASATPAAASTAKSGSLAFTGADIGSLVGGGLALAGIGAGIVLFARRPRLRTVRR